MAEQKTKQKKTNLTQTEMAYVYCKVDNITQLRLNSFSVSEERKSSTTFILKSILSTKYLYG